MGSAPGKLDVNDWKKIGKGALIGIGAAILTFLAEYIKLLPASDPKVVLSVSIGGVIINFLLRLLQDNNPVMVKK